MSENEELMVSIERLTAAAASKAQAEAEKAVAENRRLDIERQRLRIETENNNVLLSILDYSIKTYGLVMQHALEDYREIELSVAAALALARVIAARVGVNDTELVTNAIMQARGNMQVNVNQRDGGTIGNITDNSSSEKLETGELIQLIAAINNGPKAVEDRVNTLPTDMAEVAVAALQGPLAAAKMIATKVADRWHIARLTTGPLGGSNGESNTAR